MTSFSRRRLLAAAGLPLLARPALAQATQPPASSTPSPAAEPSPASAQSPAASPSHASTAPSPAATPPSLLTWNTVFFFDEDEQQLSLIDLSFYSARAGMAIAALNDRGDLKPSSLRTTDGGATWTRAPLKPRATSLQFIDESSGWIAADNGIYKSSDAGQSWRRVHKNNNLLQVRFATPDRGYAVGADATVLETQDAGKTWKPLPAAAELKTPKDRTLFDWIEHATPTVSFITGAYLPQQPRRRRADLPAWIDPPAAMRRRQTPSLSLVLQTIDGGKLWKPMSSSIFGRITRLSVGSRGLGLSLVEFEDSFDYPSEVYLLNLTTGKTDRIYRDAERHITDIHVLPDNTFLLAGYETPGRLRSAPIPGKVHILHGDTSGKWTETTVDYRATARRVRLATSPSGPLFALTDTGMILRRS